MLSLSAHEVGWLAGIVDGEGCITITMQQPGRGGRKNASYRLYLKVAMCHEQTVRTVHRMCGCGTVTIQRSPVHSTAWVWWSASREAVVVLQALRPHLITKAFEADIALEWGRLPLAQRGGNGGGAEVPPALLALRRDLFERMRDAKPSARFRKNKIKSAE